MYRRYRICAHVANRADELLSKLLMGLKRFYNKTFIGCPHLIAPPLDMGNDRTCKHLTFKIIKPRSTGIFNVMFTILARSKQFQLNQIQNLNLLLVTVLPIVLLARAGQ